MQCFKVYTNDLEKRIDPNPYHPTRLKILKKIKALEVELLPLKDVVTFRKEIVSEIPEGLPYLGLTNIESNTGLYIPSEDEKECICSAFKFYKGDILFPKLRPYLNKVHLAEFDGVCSTEIYVLKSNKCSNHYLFSFLSSSLVVNQTSFLMTGNTLPRLQTDEVENLIIPLISETNQNIIEELIQNAYKSKINKEQEAEKLLKSIDDFVLEQLGIELPEIENKMCYKIYSKEIQGNRQDPYCYQPKFEKLKEILETNKAIPLENLINLITKGETPLWRGDVYTDEGIPFLKVQNLTQYGLKGELTHIPLEVHQRMKRSQLRGNELLYTMAGTIGLAAIFPNNIGEANINQAIAKIIPKNDNDLEYLSMILNTKICKMQAEMFLTTAAQPNINFEQIKSIRIPYPDREQRDNILLEYKSRILRAEKLKLQANEEYTKAKTQVEKIILGDVYNAD